MAKPLSNLDYLIGSSSSTLSGSNANATSSVDRATEEAAVALAVPILTALSKAPGGTQTAFELVDKLSVRLEELFQVLDVLSTRFQWVDVDRSDLKGNYRVTLTQRGREYIEKIIGIAGTR
jgi:hypothetical protein